MDGSEYTTHRSLLLRVKNPADQAAWSEFVKCYGPRVFQWCRSCGLQEADAEDATQTVLLKLIGGMKAFEYESQKGKFRSWLKTVATNVSTDVLRSFRERGSGDSQFGSLLEDASLAAATESLHAQLDEAYQQELFLQARDRVQARVQASTWDAYIATCEEQRPATDVALQMKMSMSQVYVAKHRVLKLLKEEVAKLTHE